jgi:hypothetical protein
MDEQYEYIETKIRIHRNNNNNTYKTIRIHRQTTIRIHGRKIRIHRNNNNNT